jgi:hypothetical protein
VNQFGDNPYESPVVQAELARPERPYQPPQPAKPWPPIFAMIWLVAGPFVCLWVFRFCMHELKMFTIKDDFVFIFFFATTAILWLVAGARVLIWLVRSAFGY